MLENLTVKGQNVYSNSLRPCPVADAPETVDLLSCTLHRGSLNTVPSVRNLLVRYTCVSEQQRCVRPKSSEPEPAGKTTETDSHLHLRAPIVKFVKVVVLVLIWIATSTGRRNNCRACAAT